MMRDDARKLVKAGKNPVEERKVAAAQTSTTFSEWAEEIAPSIGPQAIKARKAWVHMMQVNGGRSGGAGLPQLRDGSGEEAQHAAHPLEVSPRSPSNLNTAQPQSCPPPIWHRRRASKGAC